MFSSHPCWRGLRELLIDAFVRFGAPAELAGRLWMPRGAALLLRGCLRRLEALLRQLILLDALAHPPPPPREDKLRERLGMGDAAGGHFHLDLPETWRVRYLLFARNASAAANPPTPARRTPLSNTVSTAPLAERLEAILRGVLQREALAARLARKLYAHADPAKISRDADADGGDPVILWRRPAPHGETKARPRSACAFADSS